MIKISLLNYKQGEEEFENWCKIIGINTEKFKSIKSLQVCHYDYNRNSNKYIYKDKDFIDVFYNEEEYVADRIINNEDILSSIRHCKDNIYRVSFRKEKKES